MCLSVPACVFVLLTPLFLGSLFPSQEDYLDLTVCVRGVCGLERALWDMFVEEEMFEGSNLYRCGQCDQLVTAAKVSRSIGMDLNCTCLF